MASARRCSPTSAPASTGGPRWDRSGSTSVMFSARKTTTRPRPSASRLPPSSRNAGPSTRRTGSPPMKILATSALAIAAVLFAGSAQAQAQQPTVQHGAPIAGLCALNLQGVFARSTAGQGLNARLQELQQEIAVELAPYQQTIEAEDQALSTSGASLPEAERQQRTQALQQRFAEFQQLRQTRLQELEYTEFMQRRALG